MWGLLGYCQLPTLSIGWGRRHRYLLLENREINLLPPQSDQVIFRIQERVPVTSFEDGVRGPEVTHHLHQAGLPSDGIYQQAMVVLQLQYSGKQTVVVLHPAWYNEATPCIFSVLLGISVTELQGGLAHTTMQARPRGTVPSVKVIRLSAFDVCCGIHQTTGRVCWYGDNATEIIHEEAIGTSLASIVPGLESVARLPEIDIYVLDEVVDLVGATRSVVTGYLQHYLMFGRHPCLPINYYFLTLSAYECSCRVPAYVMEVRRCFKEAERQGGVNYTGGHPTETPSFAFGRLRGGRG